MPAPAALQISPPTMALLTLRLVEQPLTKKTSATNPANLAFFISSTSEQKIGANVYKGGSGCQDKNRG